MASDIKYPSFPSLPLPSLPTRSAASRMSSLSSRVSLFWDPLGRPTFDLGGWFSFVKTWRPGAFGCDFVGAEPRASRDSLRADSSSVAIVAPICR
jgi:hypothetical protein